MRCQTCTNLEAAFQTLRVAYIENGSSVRDRISKKFAAYLQVEMERARSEFEEHRLDCRVFRSASDAASAIASTQSFNSAEIATRDEPRRLSLIKPAA